MDSSRPSSAFDRRAGVIGLVATDHRDRLGAGFGGMIHLVDDCLPGLRRRSGSSDERFS